MKLRTLLNIQRSVEERAIPSDVLEFDSTHYSKSKDVEINNNLKGISALKKRIEQRVDDIKEVVNEWVIQN